MNVDDFFDRDEFKGINKELLQGFKEMAKKVNTKTSEEAIFDIMGFYQKMQNERAFSNKERELLMQGILMSLPEKERNKFLKALEMIEGII